MNEKTPIYKLSQRSYSRLVGVNEQLIKLVETAILTTPIDFGVNEGLRTIERQKHLVDIGASHTMNSKHITGQAVDLIPYIEGTVRWEWPLYYTLAEHIRSVAKDLDISLRWGGAWDVYTFTHTVTPCKELVANYVKRCKVKKQIAFIDGPHFELCTKSIK